MKQVFPVVPASSGPFWLLGVVGVFLLALLFLFAYLAYSSRNVKFEVSAEGLRIKGDIYGRTIPARALVVDKAKILDLGKEKEYQLGWRTNGAGLPGYKSGWFRLKNGEKGLVFVTDTRRVVYLPTREGYSVLLSVARPSDFIQALRQVTQ
jgi:hypothetical protein